MKQITGKPTTDKATFRKPAVPKKRDTSNYKGRPRRATADEVRNLMALRAATENEVIECFNNWEGRDTLCDYINEAIPKATGVGTNYGTLPFSPERRPVAQHVVKSLPLPLVVATERFHLYDRKLMKARFPFLDDKAIAVLQAAYFFTAFAKRHMPAPQFTDAAIAMERAKGLGVDIYGERYPELAEGKVETLGGAKGLLMALANIF